MQTAPSSATGGNSNLARVLGLGSLIVYGLVMVQPTAPMPLYGEANRIAHGHVVTLILIGMVAMLFTALSYGRMANAYPAAGSAYTYVGRELHPALGYLTGWSMMFDYVMNPLICVIWCSKATVDLLTGFCAAQPAVAFYAGVTVPAWVIACGLLLTFRAIRSSTQINVLVAGGLGLVIVLLSAAAARYLPVKPEAGSLVRAMTPAWFVAYALLFTGLNLRAIQSSARTNYLIAGGLGLVILVFLGAALRDLVQNPTVDAAALARPFYDPETFSWKSLSNGAALAVLTYIGFDGISTLSEEVRNPRRNVLLATVLVCLIIGFLSAVEVYVAQLVWPESAASFPSLENAFAHVARRVGGSALFVVVTVALIVASIGSGMGAHLGASRLLYGMGRDDAIPKRFFGQLHPRTRVPANNILLVGGLALIGAFALDYDERGYALGAQLLNFGALTGFMGVNLSSLTHYFVRGRDRRVRHLVPPILGFLICLYLWVSLARTALCVGLAWLILGVLYGAWRTSWFRKPLAFARIETDETEVKSPSAGDP